MVRCGAVPRGAARRRVLRRGEGRRGAAWRGARGVVRCGAVRCGPVWRAWCGAVWRGFFFFCPVQLLATKILGVFSLVLKIAGAKNSWSHEGRRSQPTELSREVEDRKKR